MTGANVGLGFEAARHFARLRADKVVIACRTTSKGEDAKKSIEESTGRKGVVDVWPLDLNSYESVQAFAKRASALPRLDIVVENAGIATREFKAAEGNEMTITTNVISTFLLSLLILPKLRETATTLNITPVLTIVSSEVHFFTKCKSFCRVVNWRLIPPSAREVRSFHLRGAQQPKDRPDGRPVQRVEAP